MVGVLGFEPRVGDSESPALPLGDTPEISKMDFIESLHFCKFFSLISSRVARMIQAREILRMLRADRLYQLR